MAKLAYNRTSLRRQAALKSAWARMMEPLVEDIEYLNGRKVTKSQKDFADLIMADTETLEETWTHPIQVMGAIRAAHNAYMLLHKHENPLKIKCKKMIEGGKYSHGKITPKVDHTRFERYEIYRAGSSVDTLMQSDIAEVHGEEDAIAAAKQFIAKKAKKIASRLSKKDQEMVWKALKPTMSSQFTRLV